MGSQRWLRLERWGKRQPRTAADGTLGRGQPRTAADGDAGRGQPRTAADGNTRGRLLEEGALEGVTGGGFAEVLVGEGGGFATAGGALDEAFLDEVRLVDILDGAGVFAEGGGPLNLSMMVVRSLLSIWSRPYLSTPRASRAYLAILMSMVFLPITMAKSRTRRNRELAIRGVPRLRKAISMAASSIHAMPRMRAERATMPASTSVS